MHFLICLRHFIARRGKIFELLSDNSTHFFGGAKELCKAFKAMAPFHFNPPSAPHFGEAWESEVRSVKTALKVVLKEQSVPETFVCTVLVKVEGILNTN